MKTHARSRTGLDTFPNKVILFMCVDGYMHVHKYVHVHISLVHVKLLVPQNRAESGTIQHFQNCSFESLQQPLEVSHMSMSHMMMCEALSHDDLCHTSMCEALSHDDL